MMNDTVKYISRIGFNNTFSPITCRLILLAINIAITVHPLESRMRNKSLKVEYRIIPE